MSKVDLDRLIDTDFEELVNKLKPLSMRISFLRTNNINYYDS